MVCSRRADPKGPPQWTEKEKKASRGSTCVSKVAEPGVGARGHPKQLSTPSENTKMGPGHETWDPASHPLLPDHPEFGGEEDRQMSPPGFHV